MRSDVLRLISGGVDSQVLYLKINIDINSYQDPRYNEEKNINKNMNFPQITKYKPKNNFNLEILTDLIKYHDQLSAIFSCLKQISNDGYKVSISEQLMIHTTIIYYSIFREK